MGVRRRGPLSPSAGLGSRRRGVGSGSAGLCRAVVSSMRTGREMARGVCVCGGGFLEVMGLAVMRSVRFGGFCEGMAWF